MRHLSGPAVPTENYIRDGADAAMGYPRFGMIDLLKLPGGFLVGLFQIACGSRSRDGISPPAGSCPEAVRASEAQAAYCRSPDLRLALEPLHFALSPTYRLMRVFGAIIFPQPLLVWAD
jgi:hypothetical protein